MAVNEAFCHMLGRSEQELKKLAFPDVVHADHRDVIRRHFQQQPADEPWSTQMNIRLAGAQNEHRRVLVIAQRSRGARSRIQLRLADLSEVGDPGGGAEIVNAIEHAAWEWRRTFDAVETPIVIVGGDATISRINRAARMLVGRDYGDIVGRSIGALPNSEPWLSMADLTREVQERRSPAARQVKDSYGRTLDLLAMLFNAEDPNDRHVIVVVWDVSALVDLQARLEQQRTMATMGALVAGVAHEVRNPLFAISATVDAMEQAADGKLAEYFEVLREEIDRMTALMQDLLAYGRPTAPVFATVAVADIIEAAMHASTPLAAKHRVELKKVIRADFDIVADRDRLCRAVQNLIDNAIQHSRADSEVTVVSLPAGQKKRGRYAQIKVSDHGPGFAQDDLPRLFEPFFSRRRGGTGLGLALVQQIVTEHGGTVAASNRQGGGAEVVIEIPLPPEKR